MCIYIHIHICAGLLPKSLQLGLTLQPYGLSPARLLCPWDSPDKNTTVGCHALLQGIFPIQGLNPYLLCLLHGQEGSSPLLPYVHIHTHTHTHYCRKCIYIYINFSPRKLSYTHQKSGVGSLTTCSCLYSRGI